MYAAELHHPIAMLELAIYYSGSDAENRHGQAPKEQVNLALSHEYFARIRDHKMNSRAFAWHPLMRKYLEADIETAIECMQEFEKSYPAIVQASAAAAARVGSQSQPMPQSQSLQPSASIKSSTSSSASIAQDDAVPSAPKKNGLLSLKERQQSKTSPIGFSNEFNTSSIVRSVLPLCFELLTSTR